MNTIFKDNYDSDDSDEFDDCETYFQTELIQKTANYSLEVKI